MALAFCIIFQPKGHGEPLFGFAKFEYILEIDSICVKRLRRWAGDRHPDAIWNNLFIS